MRGLAAPDPAALSTLERTLRHYADLIDPWAKTVARYMVTDVQRRNLNAWKQNSADMGRALRDELANAPAGGYFAVLMNEQVGLIKSLPTEAAERVHKLAEEMMVSGTRRDYLEKKILETGHVTASRARLIARTEVARTAATFTQARAEYAGSTEYIWRTSRDGDVRPTHRAVEGRTFKWTNPPKTDKGLAPYHPGCGPNCRCFAEPIFPND